MLERDACGGYSSMAWQQGDFEIPGKWTAEGVHDKPVDVVTFDVPTVDSLTTSYRLLALSTSPDFLPVCQTRNFSSAEAGSWIFKSRESRTQPLGSVLNAYSGLACCLSVILTH